MSKKINYKLSANPGEAQRMVLDNMTTISSTPDGITMLISLSGDRIICCDEAILACEEISQRLIGAATIAPHGEAMQQGSKPEIVGVGVLPEYRRQGIGSEIIRRAALRILERMDSGELKQQQIRVDLLTKAARQAFQKVIDENPELQGKLELNSFYPEYK